MNTNEIIVSRLNDIIKDINEQIDTTIIADDIEKLDKSQSERFIKEFEQQRDQLIKIRDVIAVKGCNDLQALYKKFRLKWFKIETTIPSIVSYTPKCRFVECLRTLTELGYKSSLPNCENSV